VKWQIYFIILILPFFLKILFARIELLAKLATGADTIEARPPLTGSAASNEHVKSYAGLHLTRAVSADAHLPAGSSLKSPHNKADGHHLPGSSPPSYYIDFVSCLFL